MYKDSVIYVVEDYRTFGCIVFYDKEDAVEYIKINDKNNCLVVKQSKLLERIKYEETT